MSLSDKMLDAMCHLDQKEPNLHHTQKEADGDNEDEEDTWEP